MTPEDIVDAMSAGRAFPRWLRPEIIQAIKSAEERGRQAGLEEAEGQRCAIAALRYIIPNDHEWHAPWPGADDYERGAEYLNALSSGGTGDDR